MYTIRQATQSDWPIVASFIDRNYGSSAKFKGEARWNWQFRNSPYGTAQLDNVPIWIALHGDEVVGQIALQPGLMWLDGEAIPADWVVDVMVDSHHRGRKLSHMINEAILASGRTIVTLTMALPTRRVMERAGCITLPPVSQMVRLKRLSARTLSAIIGRIGENRDGWKKLIELFIRSKLGPSALAGILSVGSRLLRKVRRTERQDMPMDQVTSINPADLERLAAALRRKIPAMFDRSEAFYSWRFERVPDLDYKYGTSADAAVVWRLPLSVELPIGTIVDILCDPDDDAAIGAAIDHAIFAMESRCEGIIAGASDQRFIRQLSRRGFVTVKRHYPTVASRDKTLLARIANYGGPWHFSKADHDWDQVHPVDH